MLPRKRKAESSNESVWEPAPRPQKQQHREIPRRKLERKIGRGWDRMLDECSTYYKDLHEQERKKRRVFTRDVASTDRLHEESQVPGDIILQNIRKRLGTFGLVKTKTLRDIQNILLISNLFFIYGNDYVRKIPELLIKFGEKDKPLEEISQMNIITTMRQQGKTTGIQSTLAAFMLELERWKAVCFAPTKRQSSALAIGTADFIRKSPGGAERIARTNQEELVVTPATAGEVHKDNKKNSILRCLPGSEKGGLFVCCVS